MKYLTKRAERKAIIDIEIKKLKEQIKRLELEDEENE